MEGRRRPGLGRGRDLGQSLLGHGGLLLDVLEVLSRDAALNAGAVVHEVEEVVGSDVAVVRLKAGREGEGPEVVAREVRLVADRDVAAGGGYDDVVHSTSLN